MAEVTQNSSPTSSHDQDTAGSRSQILKDRKCPFCHQQFTSSSLGRHLDLYIRENNPKAPDGIHLPEEIRAIRGHITRRRARNSTGLRASSTPTTNSTRPTVEEAPVPLDSTPTQNAAQNADLTAKWRTRFNEPGWEATGVIRDVVNTSKGKHHAREHHRDVSGSTVKSTIERRRRMQEKADDARAAELALREVLGGVQAASGQINHNSPFDFNPFELTFPALALQCLEKPPTLFSTHSFPTSTSWSLEPPGEMQYQSLQRFVRTSFQRWRPEAYLAKSSATAKHRDRPNSMSSAHNAVSDPSSPTGSPRTDATSQEEDILSHLSEAYAHWKRLPSNVQHEHWRLEALRAYTRCDSRRRAADASLHEARQEIVHLRAQVDQLSRAQSSQHQPPPPEFLTSAPATIPLSRDAAHALHVTSSENAWDFDNIMAKWRAIVQKNRQEAGGLAAQRSLDSDEEGFNDMDYAEDTTEGNPPVRPLLGPAPAVAAALREANSAFNDTDMIDADDNVGARPAPPQQQQQQHHHLQPSPQPAQRKTRTSNQASPTRPSPATRHSPPKYQPLFQVQHPTPTASGNSNQPPPQRPQQLSPSLGVTRSGIETTSPSSNSQVRVRDVR